MAADSAPFLEGDFYKTWFYFSVTGVPQGEQLTFTFKNLNNQVSYFPKLHLKFKFSPVTCDLEQTLLPRTQAGLQNSAELTKKLAPDFHEG